MYLVAEVFPIAFVSKVALKNLCTSTSAFFALPLNFIHRSLLNIESRCLGYLSADYGQYGLSAPSKDVLLGSGLETG